MVLDYFQITTQHQTNKQEKKQNVNQICEITFPCILQKCKIEPLLQQPKCKEVARLFQQKFNNSVVSAVIL